MIRIVDGNNKQLAILDKLINPIIKEQINGEYIFTFTTVIEELKSEYIHHDNYIETDDNLFQIAKYTKERTQDNKVLIHVLAEQMSYKLIDISINSFLKVEKTALEMLTDLLVDTGFTVGTVSVSGKTTVLINETANKREVLKAIQEAFGGELQFNRYSISLLHHRGQNNGVEFRVGKNVKGIKKIVDNTKKDEYGNPSVSYEVNIIELNEHEDFKGLEGFEIGDTINKIIDTELGISISARIVEIEKDPTKHEKSTKVVLGNIIEDITTFNLKTMERLRKVSNRVTDVEFKITDDAIISTVTASEPFREMGTQITQTAEAITLTAENVDLLENRVAEAEFKIEPNQIISTVANSAKYQEDFSSITQRADSIELSVTSLNDTVSTQGNNITNQASLISQNASAIALQAASVTSLGENLASLEVKANSIETNVSSLQNTVSGHVTTLSTHTSQISQNATAITQKVSTTDYNGNTIASKINQTATNIKLSANKIDLDGITAVSNFLTLGALTNSGSIIFNDTSSISGDRSIGDLKLDAMNTIRFISGSSISFNTPAINFGNAAVSGLDLTARFG
ncbi:prophage endopeptidase tail family protein [Clostridium formicaceticum]|uniref:Chromosome partition protein Smc n=1 Tax=Clostridium formicaceticum TaxID=1497 RepID=A0AAC9WG39_9CLOT|nr:prophage endopeptidase tail family protein [Clostridium formicaceticum]AOY76925.1 hypothetical protein BJL90_14305 [Clostridium formicaceticum]ARE87404.1 Chromosome partition protein Smc [Clostridium formicaceticum]